MQIGINRLFDPLAIVYRLGERERQILGQHLVGSRQQCSHVLVKTSEQRCEWLALGSCGVERICWRREVRGKSECVIKIPVDCECLAIIVIGQRKSTTDRSLPIIGCPSDGESRLEVVLVPVVKRFTAISRAAPVYHYRGDEILSLGGSGQTILKVSSQWNCGL